MPKKFNFTFSDIKRYSIKKRFSMVSTASFSSPYSKGSSFDTFIKTLPKTLKASELLELVDILKNVIEEKKTFILGIGGHVIKTGLSPLIVDLLKQGYISHMVLNGAGLIHDFELAFNCATSENVDTAIENGSFGMAEETGRIINQAIVEPSKGLGYNLGKFIFESDYKNKNMSILAACYDKKIPVSVHVAFGTDIIHCHPEFDAKVTGEATHVDFLKLVKSVTVLDKGAFISFGSAVIIPEVFLKALTVARNLGFKVNEIYSAYFDFMHQYRPATNIVKRPTSLGGKGFYFIGHHELMMPLFIGCLKESLGK